MSAASKKEPPGLHRSGSTKNVASNCLSPPAWEGKAIPINKYRDLCRKRIQEFKHKELTSTRKLVLMQLVDYLNSEDHTAWPAFDTLAADTGFSRSTVIRAINVASSSRDH